MRLRQSDYHQRRARAPFVIPDLGARNPAGPGPRPVSRALPERRSMDPAAARPNFGPAFWSVPAPARVSVGREVLRALAWLAALALVAVALVLWSPIP